MTATTGLKTKRTKTIIGIAAALAVVIGTLAIALFTGFFPGINNSSTHPPCSELPAKKEVHSALTSHEALANNLKSQGSDIQVSVGTPCADDLDAALVQVTYTENASRDAIETVLTESDGFGVPVYVTHR